MKTCTKCGIEKPLEAFHKAAGGAGGRSSHCALCRNITKRGRYTARERKEKHLLHKFSISLDDHDILYMSQKGQCGIREKKIPQHDKGTHVDHCHTTNKIRGILCQNCNRGLGFMGDSIETLLKAALYLERNRV